MKVAVDVIKVNKLSRTMFSWDMPKWAYDMRIELMPIIKLLYIILYKKHCYKLSVIYTAILFGITLNII